jgi:hypothetical protein
MVIITSLASTAKNDYASVGTILGFSKDETTAMASILVSILLDISTAAKAVTDVLGDCEYQSCSNTFPLLTRMQPLLPPAA